MIRNLKALGVALGALFTLGAVAASSASAVDTLTGTVVEPAAVVVTATNANTNQFKITNKDGGQTAGIECSHAKFAGTITSSGAKEVTIFATYNGTKTDTNNAECTTSLGNAKVDMSGCDYDLTGETTQEDKADGTGQKDAAVSVTCKNAGEEIKITAPLGCTISVPAQTPTEGGVIYTNEKEENPAKSGTNIRDVRITRDSDRHHIYINRVMRVHRHPERGQYERLLWHDHSDMLGRQRRRCEQRRIR